MSRISLLIYLNDIANRRLSFSHGRTKNAPSYGTFFNNVSARLLSTCGRYQIIPSCFKG